MDCCPFGSCDFRQQNTCMPDMLINFVCTSISKFSMNTGDELRARVTYVYENVDKAYGTASVAKMPKIVEPAPPSFINLYIGGARIAVDCFAHFFAC